MPWRPILKHLAGLAVAALLVGALLGSLGALDLAGVDAAWARRWSLVGVVAIVVAVNATFQLRWIERLFGFVGLFLPGREDRSESGFTVFGNKLP